MTRRSDSIVLAEQQLAEARAAVRAEYQALRAKLSRRAGSPAFIGGALLGAVALGYLVTRRGKPGPAVYVQNPGAWSHALNTARVLLPLLLALGSATRSARRPGVGGARR